MGSYYRASFISRHVEVTRLSPRAGPKVEISFPQPTEVSSPLVVSPSSSVHGPGSMTYPLERFLVLMNEYVNAQALLFPSMYLSRSS